MGARRGGGRGLGVGRSELAGWGAVSSAMCGELGSRGEECGEMVTVV